MDAENNKQAQPKARRLLRVDQIYSRKDRQIHYVPTSKAHKQKNSERMNKAALVVRRIISSKGIVTDTEVDVKSTALRDVLLEINEGVQGLGLNKEPPMLSRENIFRCLPELKLRLEKEKLTHPPNHALISDIDTAIELMHEDFGDTISELRSLAPHQEIDYKNLWALFKPNNIVIASESLTHEYQAMIFNDGFYGERNDGSRYYGVRGKILHHDGYYFGWAPKTYEIDIFTGVEKVHKLAALPLEKHPDKDVISATLINRGRVYLELQGHHLREYDGAAIREEKLMDGNKERVPFNATGRIMLDPVAFHQQNPHSSTLLKPYTSKEVDVASLEEHQIICCAITLLGFSFSRKEWGAFSISKTAAVVWNETAFDKLVIDPHKRDVVHSLVRSHRTDSHSFDDVVQNKGRGLVGLLGGNPGVGKTLTAEAVAETTKRPLYMVSAGELGTDPKKVDDRLEMILDIARRWGCVLLIDEADVFLEAREPRDIQRNALVSIFLRRLEYFQGILILTTNRGKFIDPAFQSRIHFKLHYPDLDDKSRAAIWRNFMETTASEIPDIRVSDEDIEALSKIPLNGRQIKNVVSCSVSIAREDKIPLTTERIRTILGVVVDEI